jgi:hypothetical protein
LYTYIQTHKHTEREDIYIYKDVYIARGVPGQKERGGVEREQEREAARKNKHGGCVWDNRGVRSDRWRHAHGGAEKG